MTSLVFSVLIGSSTAYSEELSSKLQTGAPSPCASTSIEDATCKITKPVEVDSKVNAQLKAAFVGRYTSDCFSNPCMVMGDFDGDKKDDKAILIKDTRSHKTGVAFLFGNGKQQIIGAGAKVDHIGTSLDWLMSWKLEKSENFLVVLGSQIKRRDVLILTKKDDKSGVLWWDGKTFHWDESGAK